MSDCNRPNSIRFKLTTLGGDIAHLKRTLIYVFFCYSYRTGAVL
jgi:hypothetical protein